MPKPTYVQIAKGDIIGSCTQESVESWERDGWTVVDDSSSETGSSEPGERVVIESSLPELYGTDEEGAV
jgi:hypothetical protein